MLAMDQPSLDPPSHGVVLVTQTSPSKTMYTSKRGQLGICYQVHNSPSRITTSNGIDREEMFEPGALPAQSAIVPYFALLYYLKHFAGKMFHQNNIDGYSVEVKLVKAPTRGELKESNCEDISKGCREPVFYYQPREKGIYGRDHAIIEIKAGEHSLRVHYYIDMMDSLYFRRFDDYCGRDRPVWKISSGSDTPIFQAEAGGPIVGNKSDYEDTITETNANKKGKIQQVTKPMAPIKLSVEDVTWLNAYNTPHWLQYRFGNGSSLTGWVNKADPKVITIRSLALDCKICESWRSQVERSRCNHMK